MIVEDEPKEIKKGESIIAFIEPKKPLIYGTYLTTLYIGKFV